jgi:hypothetical protein
MVVMRNGRSVGLMVLVLAFAGCEAEFSVSTAKLSEAKMASAINTESKAPTAVASTFAPDIPAIFATTKLSNAPSDTKVKATFHYLEGGDREIAADEVEAGGTCYVAFTLSAPSNGWPVGQYETRFYLNGKEVQRQPFNVTAASAAVPQPPAAAGAGDSRPAAAPAARPRGSSPAPTAAAATKRFRDETFGIELELPSAWGSRLTPSKDYILEGAKGTDAFELSVIIQFVTKSTNPGSSAVAQAKKVAGQIEGAPNGAIKTRDTLSMAGQEAPYFVATYTASDSRGVATAFAHTQIVLDHGAYYYLISYSGPQPIYQKYLGTFQEMVGSFRFTS